MDAGRYPDGRRPLSGWTQGRYPDDVVLLELQLEKLELDLPTLSWLKRHVQVHHLLSSSIMLEDGLEGNEEDVGTFREGVTAKDNLLGLGAYTY